MKAFTAVFNSSSQILYVDSAISLKGIVVTPFILDRALKAHGFTRTGDWISDNSGALYAVVEGE